MKKYTNYYLAFSIFFVMFVVGDVAYAQRYSANRDTVADSPFDGQDGERISNWRGSGAMQTSINQLSPNPVQEIFIPVLFGVSLSDIYPNFGDPRSGGTRTHAGEDIIAPQGDPVISPTDAVVLSVGTGANSGYYVYTANPGAETFVYMHLESMSVLKPGDILKPGDLIGYVGNTGNASGGGAHLHFEIRKDNTATDPYPRIKRELTATEKMQFITQILQKSSNPTLLAESLVKNYLKEFIDARTIGIVLPVDITNAMDRLSVAVAPALGTSDLSLGARSNDVVALQNFLIMQNKGAGARALSSAGATGYFGAITRTALVEYQSTVGLPATGVYDSSTRAFVKNGTLPSVPSTPLPPIVSPSNPQPPTVPSNTTAVPVVDLTINSRGADVVWLQTFLIEKKVGPLSGALISAGATGYFGTITRLALAEYQASVGISPAVGYFGSITRAYIAIHR